MPKKALRSSLRKAEVNRRIRSQAKTALTKFAAKASAENLSTAFSALDKAVKGKQLHKNKVARIKSQLSKKLA